MDKGLIDDPVLSRFRAALDKLYGDRIERVVLFGSQARGDAQGDSDYDVAVFLRDLTDRWRDLRTEMIGEAFFDAKPYPAGAYRDGSPLMHEIRRDGIDL